MVHPSHKFRTFPGPYRQPITACAHCGLQRKDAEATGEPCLINTSEFSAMHDLLNEVKRQELAEKLKVAAQNTERVKR